jgi:hypothetical protein
LACDDQGQFFMLTPPYSENNRQSLNEPEALRLILDQGVPLDAREFDSWDDLATNLLRELARRSAQEQPGQEQWRTILARSTPQRLRVHLKKVERWLQEGKTKEAGEVLSALLQMPVVAGDPQLQTAVQNLLALARVTGIT